jgi:hypothetical protein
MARKYNTRHPARGRSNYPARLARRGLTRAPALASVDSLRRRQATPDWLAAHPAIAESLAAYHGR